MYGTSGLDADTHVLEPGGFFGDAVDPRALDAEGIDAAVLYPSPELWVPFVFP